MDLPHAKNLVGFKDLYLLQNRGSGKDLEIIGNSLEPQPYTIKYLKKVSELIAGQSFGELSLIYNKPRLATIKSETPVEFATLTKKSYDETIKILEQEKIDKKIQELDSIPFFKEYSRAFKSRLLFAVEIKDFFKNQVVFKEGKSDGCLYFIIKGEFEV